MRTKESQELRNLRTLCRNVCVQLSSQCAITVYILLFICTLHDSYFILFLFFLFLFNLIVFRHSSKHQAGVAPPTSFYALLTMTIKASDFDSDSQLKRAQIKPKPCLLPGLLHLSDASGGVEAAGVVALV